MTGHHLRLLRQHPNFECDFETARRIGAPLVLVDKLTREISRHVVIESFARLDGMRRVGPWPDEMDFA